MALRLHSLTCSITYNGLMDCNIATVQGGVRLQRCIKLPKSQIATILSHMAIQIARAHLTWVTPYWHALGLEKSSSAEYGRVRLLSIGNNQANLVADPCSKIQDQCDINFYD